MAHRAPITLGVSLKLYLDTRRTVSWAERVGAVARGSAAVQDGSVQIFVLPSVPALIPVHRVLERSKVAVGAQDLFWEDRGAFTGGISGSDLREAGCRYVEVGHAERRTVFGETDEIIARKFEAALRNGLTPVVCVGEVDRAHADDAALACIGQLEATLSRAASTSVPRLVIAYEPVWAIGATDPAPTQHVATVTSALRAYVADYSRIEEAAVIYGGSAKPGLLTALGHSVDGLFLGRFAHDPDQLALMVDEAAALATAPLH